MKPTIDTIVAPPFPAKLQWLNVASLRMDKQIGRPVLVEFWDFCRVNSLRTAEYMKAWHQRYAEHGLRVIGIHSPGFEASRDPEAVAAAVERLGIEYPVVIDTDLEIWEMYGNRGWPARYLWDAKSILRYYHYGEGDYQTTELEIQSLLDIELPPLAPIHPEDNLDVELVPQSEDQPGAYSGPYEAGAVWAVFDGKGSVTVNDRSIEIDGPGCYPMVEHSHSEEGELSIKPNDGVNCLGTLFLPGIAKDS